jgi:hypothetical protein
MTTLTHSIPARRDSGQAGMIFKKIIIKPQTNFVKQAAFGTFFLKNNFSIARGKKLVY